MNASAYPFLLLIACAAVGTIIFAYDCIKKYVNDRRDRMGINSPDIRPFHDIYSVQDFNFEKRHLN